MNFERLILAQINAYYGWLMEEGHVPMIVVMTQYEGVRIPDYLKANDTVNLNVGMTATEQMTISEAAMNFKARFGGRSYDCYVPLRAIRGFIVPLQLTEKETTKAFFPLLEYPASTVSPVSAVPQPNVKEAVQESIQQTVEIDESLSSADGKVVSLFPRKKS